MQLLLFVLISSIISRPPSPPTAHFEELQSLVTKPVVAATAPLVETVIPKVLSNPNLRPPSRLSPITVLNRVPSPRLSPTKSVVGPLIDEQEYAHFLPLEDSWESLPEPIPPPKNPEHSVDKDVPVTEEIDKIQPKRWTRQKAAKFILATGAAMAGAIGVKEVIDRKSTANQGRTFKTEGSALSPVAGN